MSAKAVGNAEKDHSSSTHASRLSTKLPSLGATVSRSATKLNDSFSFVTSVPIFSRSRYDVFGTEELDFNKSELRTPKHVKREIEEKNRKRLARLEKIAQYKEQQSAKRAEAAKKEEEEKIMALANSGMGKLNLDDAHRARPQSQGKQRGKKSRYNGDYIVSRTTKKDPYMLSHGERKEKMVLVAQKRKDRSQYQTQQPRSETPEALFTSLLLASSSDGGEHAGAGSLRYEESGMLGVDPFVVARTASIESEENALSNQFDKYFGVKSRVEFAEKYKKTIAESCSRSAKDETAFDGEGLSPRSHYLGEINKNNLLPLPLILRKETNPLGLYLGHRGLGDTRMLPLVNVLEKLPALQTIDLCDNRLTDATLMPFAEKIRTLHSLTYLDLSFNKIDESSAVIMEYLEDDRCKLNTLLLNGADVDDSECVNISKAISVNKSLQTLGLASNLIGNAELLNVLHPDLVTGGEALGDMLRANQTLTKLDLSWNSIRLESAVALAQALEVNTTLKTLLLGYNSFGDIPSQVLGRTLKSNKALTELDLESNSITPKAATVLANAISFNEALLKLNINGNVLGKIGAQALVAAIQRSSTDTRKLQVSFVNCDCRQEDDQIFSAASPHGVWRLNLVEPYGQMVAAECLYLANHRAGCKIDRLLYNGEQVHLERSFSTNDKDADVKKFKFKEFLSNCNLAADALLRSEIDEAARLLQLLLDQFEFSMVEEERLAVLGKTLELWKAKSIRERREDLHEVFLYEVFFALFVINDTDMSGTMELDEFLETLASLGKPNFDRDIAKRLMAEHDRDESGSIDANEFGMIMLNEFCKTEMPKGDLVDSSTGCPWDIPSSGTCVIYLSYNSELPSLFDIGEDYGIDNIISSIKEAKTDDQREILFQNTTSSPYFFLSFEQGQMLLDVMQGLNRLPLDVMASILPQIVNCEQAIKFIDLNLNDMGKLALRIRVGALYNAYVGLYSGHYAIDMKHAEQKNGAKRLGAICITEGKYCREVGANPSQKGNFSNFRNEKLGYTQNVDITGRWFSSPAGTNCTKVLHCDYVSTTKARKGQPAVSDAKFQALIFERLNLPEIRQVWDKLAYRQVQFQQQMDRFSMTPATALGLPGFTEGHSMSGSASIGGHHAGSGSGSSSGSFSYSPTFHHHPYPHAAAGAFSLSGTEESRSRTPGEGAGGPSGGGGWARLVVEEGVQGAEEWGGWDVVQQQQQQRSGTSGTSGGTARKKSRTGHPLPSFSSATATTAEAGEGGITSSLLAAHNQAHSAAAAAAKEQQQQQSLTRPSTANSSINGISAPGTLNKSMSRLSMFENKNEARERLQLLSTMLPVPFPINPLEFEDLVVEPPLSIPLLKEAHSEYIETCHHYWDIYPEERMRDVSRANYSATEKPATPAEMKAGEHPPSRSSGPHAIFSLVYKKLLLLQIHMPTYYFTVEQVAHLLSYFPPEEGYYRIQLLTSVFSHIVDVENAYIIVDKVLTHDERMEAFHRIGVMNLLDPMKPDRLYRLDLRRFDHRELVKILVALAVAEPGDNWELTEYRWGKYDDPVPGWDLPATWTYFDDGGNSGGPRNHGWLRVRYRSYGNGCMPIMSVRRQLRKRTLAGMKHVL